MAQISAEQPQAGPSKDRSKRNAVNKNIADSRFAQQFSENENDQAGSSLSDSGEVFSGSEDEDDNEDEHNEELGEGMHAEGFAGPSEKVVKPLTPEALAAFKAAQDRAGVIYISRIPPGMRPTKVRHIMSGYGEVGRVYLQPEGKLAVMSVMKV